MTTALTRMVARLLLVPVLMVAAAFLIKGYVDVGDGFGAGVIAALGVLLQYLAFGRAAVERVLPVRHA
ncbi:MAG TPA: MnhB domain-containing protein, partial [Actinomycetota bacterium]|nr:MnhB domain-containing protein [Actinomycetota bacterium]